MKRVFLIVILPAILLASMTPLVVGAQESPLSVIREQIQVGGADVNSIAWQRNKKYVCKLQHTQGHYLINFNTLSGKKCRVEIPFKKNLAESSIVSLSIRGDEDVQNFSVGLKTDTQTEYAGPIYEFLPYSVVSNWTQTGFTLYPLTQKGLDLKKIKKLVLNFTDPGEGRVEIKNIRSVKRMKGVKNWEAVIVHSPQYKLAHMKDYKTMSIGYYGIEFGWKPGHIYDRPSEKSFSSGKFQIKDLKAKRPEDRDYVKVADFNEGLQNNLGGFFNEFYKEPSFASVTMARSNHQSPRGKSLKIKYVKKIKGFCGGWVHLFDFKQSPMERTYFDGTSYQYLSFWIKGAKGKEDISVQLADARWEKDEDSVYYGKVSKYLPKGVTTKWQRVVIPLKKDFYKNIMFKKLAAIVFNLREVSEGTIFIDDVSFSSSKNFPEDKVLPQKTKKKIQKKLIKSIWLWHSDRQLKDKKNQIELLTFCKKQGVNLIFFQMLYNLKKNKDGTYTCILKHKKALQDFITRANSYGVEIHALDGFSRFALKPWHEKVLAQIRAIIAYNKSVPQKARFTGIHHDNEPYLIPYYWGMLKEDIMLQYLELCKKSQKLVDNSGLKNFVFGVDIPFWYEEANFDFKIPAQVTYNGVRKPVSYHIIDMVDNVGIMDYRTKSYGADGTIVHGRDEIIYANKVGKSILIGLETYPLPEEIFAVFRSHKKAKLRDLTKKIEKNPRVLFMAVDQVEELGILYMRRFRLDLKDTPQQISKEIGTLTLTHKQTVYESDIAVDVPSKKLSFAGMKRDYFERIYDETVDYFLDEPSFKGTAIHYYETYQELMENN